MILGIIDYWRIFYLVIVWSINQFNTLWLGLQVSEFLHKGFTRAGLDVDFVWNSGWVTNKKCCNKLIFKLIFEIDLFLYNSRILYTLSIEEELLNEFFLGSSILNSKNSSWYCYHDKNRLKNEQCQLKLQLSFIKKNWKKRLSTLLTFGFQELNFNFLTPHCSKKLYWSEFNFLVKI